ncbi:uncharacterized protein BDCG_00034 [Blastomyces dermatitidis ER-3]|uniref:Uncharacterized protein n=1 Tax=Ajellomyces dermatitidis (strain ER-3 / ATCC MYA-2586) TaxID=559297 RepID=A0ABP2EJK1_AJEDR|nr:uncharacterized protein BDCG_00034 [Blastomyces dermatitidis ER-3]EEQ83229.2 hypothetical protein BDCG_00034 [Blastomyces dermatitidis ER-3]
MPIIAKQIGFLLDRLPPRLSRLCLDFAPAQRREFGCPPTWAHSLPLPSATAHVRRRLLLPPIPSHSHPIPSSVSPAATSSTSSTANQHPANPQPPTPQPSRLSQPS